MESGAEGRLFNIQRFSTKDGPGIRTSLYLKGCNLSCLWCHNPESIAPSPQIQFFSERCRLCGLCVGSCPNHCHGITAGVREFSREACVVCGACVDACPAEALVQCGRTVSAEEMLAIIGRDARYFQNSGGGVTLSGGEPLLQSGFSLRILHGARDAGIHSAIDTALNVPWATIAECVPLADLWLVDIKHMDPERHRSLTGVSNAHILANLERLFQSGARLWIRLPLISGLNDDVENMERTADFLARREGLESVQLLPYHNYGINKADSLALDRHAREFAPPGPERLGTLRKVLLSRAIPCQD